MNPEFRLIQAPPTPHKEPQILVPSLEDRRRVLAFYGLDPVDTWRSNHRGLVNKTFELDSRFFLTIYQGRTPRELQAVAEITNSMSDAIPVTRPFSGETGYAVPLEDGHALLTRRLPGMHYVGFAHTEKYPIPRELHRSLARFFWEFQEELSAAPEHLKAVLRSPSRATIGKMPDIIPEMAESLTKYAPAGELPSFSYPDLIHDDLERQNILSVGDTITGIVDLDSIRSGDVLYEFGHFLFNNVFCDPEADNEIASFYIKALKRAGRINPKDISSLYGHIYRFAISDIADFQDLILNSPSDQVIDLALLVQQYGRALSFASSFFKTLEEPNNV